MSKTEKKAEEYEDIDQKDKFIRGIDMDTYNKIKDTYVKNYTSSWAVWEKPGKNIKSDMGDVSFLKNPTQELLNILNPNIILVSLNVSKNIKLDLFLKLASDLFDCARL